jgi:preprotein translocase subunit SecA
MFNFFKKIFDYNLREIERLQTIVDKINAQEDEIRKLLDKDFPLETAKFKAQIQKQEVTLDEILPRAFALVREASRRVLGERHFDTQLMAGIVLHQGKIAEQKTGEGKTLSATTALYLNALTGRGVHLVTVNDYLARRDAGWMGMVYHFLGLQTAAIISDRSFIFDSAYKDHDVIDWRLAHLREISRKQAYQADIIYGINSEFGFDYLRDNMAQTVDDLVQRGFYYAIIDEADSVLIDEARTPHIISVPYQEDTSRYYQYSKIVKLLDKKEDYVVDEKHKTANLTEAGIKKIESILRVDNIYEKDFDTLYHIEAALKAMTLFQKDKDYIVKNGEVIIVDEFTGRLLIGRRFSEGLHQAIEAKEGVAIQQESKTLATISLQNYFRMYEKLAGMTGTAATEAEEFHKIYKTEVVVLPTHRPLIRKDHPDLIYKTEKAKYNAVVEEIIANYKKGRPVLVGTTSIQKNERLSQFLTQRGIPHELLNAKNHEREALIISNAGKKQAVTVATNMAGRGVDIILGGQPPNEYEYQNKEEYKKDRQKWQEQHDEIIKLGGLCVIGTERHESRRIDNQLRGRAGRQGDPGETKFFVSLEDDLMRIFGGEQITNIMNMLNFPEDQPLSHPMVSRAIEQAQVKVEGFNFDIRKHLVEYDDVLNKQRGIIYQLRKKILSLPSQDLTQFKQLIFTLFQEEIESLVNSYLSLEDNLSSEIKTNFLREINLLVPLTADELESNYQGLNTEKLICYLNEKVKKQSQVRENELGENLWVEITKTLFLTTIDKYWMDHLTAIDNLREGINLRGFAQLDPLVEYKNEAYLMFEKLMSNINFEVTRRLFKIEVSVAENTKPQAVEYKSASAMDPFQASLSSSTGAASFKSQLHQQEQQAIKVTLPGEGKKKPGRNDPCWCGSGKKYKKCHYPN